MSRAFEKVRDEYKKNPSIDILRVISNYYYTLLDPKNITKEKYPVIEKCYYDFIKRFAINLFDGIPMEIQQVLAKFAQGNDFLPQLSLDSYLKYLKSKYE